MGSTSSSSVPAAEAAAAASDDVLHGRFYGTPTSGKAIVLTDSTIKELTVSAASVTLHMWQSVVIDVEPEKLNPRNKLLKFLLVEPRIPGFNDLKRARTDDDNVLPAATAGTSQEPR